MLNLETLRSQVPSIFATTPAPKMSQKYTFVPTVEILENFDREGWKVFSAKQNGMGDYSTHEIRFQRHGRRSKRSRNRRHRPIHNHRN